MSRLILPSESALATELEVQRFVWRRPALASSDPGGHTDEEQDILCAILNGVSAAVEQHLGGVIKRSYVESYDGGQEFIPLRHGPIVQVSSVVELTQPLTENVDFAVYREAGKLRRLPAIQSGWWPPGSMAVRRVMWAPFPKAVAVTYTAGWATQERDANGSLVAVRYDEGGEAIRTAVLIWCHYLWAAGPAAYGPTITEAGLAIRPTGMPAPVERLLAPYWRLAGALAP